MKRVKIDPNVCPRGRADMARARIDPNVRVRGNGTYAEDADLDRSLAELAVGDPVLLYEPEDGCCWDGRVSELTEHFLYFAVDWASGRDYE